ncbi:MAG: lycopene cyclase domain-containing protein [Saprospiraceae bacterium]|nr:lycopene cyclase domain-containing protein [Saprospiraceae bacterium]
MKTNFPIHNKKNVGGNHSKISIFIFLGVLVWGGYILSRPIFEAELTKLSSHLYQIPFFESSYLYFYHHLFALIPVVLALMIYPFFGTRIYFYIKWLVPIIIGSIPFIVWDILFSKAGVWGFNTIYISGIGINSFPVEEILWFPVIGICSLFVYELITHKKLLLDQNGNENWVFLAVFCFFGMSVIFHERIYTGFSSWSVGFMALIYRNYDLSGLFVRVFRSFMVLLIPMFLFDGLLTGMFTKEGLVIYNLEECIGVRMVSIPIEDFLFGFSFILLIIFIENRIAKHWKQ